MKKISFSFCMVIFFAVSTNGQDMVSAAAKFIQLLDSGQKSKLLYPFDVDERYLFHYFPIPDRKGLPMDQLTKEQRSAALALIQSGLSEKAAGQVQAIMQLESLLKVLEHRKADDHFRDPGKYYFTVFGIPDGHTTWGWRLDGHHVCFSFSVQDRKLVSGTPGFLGSNPAIVQEGAQKGQDLLQDEREFAFRLLHGLSDAQMRQALIKPEAPGDILTYVNRRATIENPEGILYSAMEPAQQQQFLALISLYIHRYTKLFADDMLKEIQDAGLNKLRFAWAGATQPGIGNPHYYRIQGPTIIIEYDNTQNNANHVHTVVRDLLHDFGGDLLLEHYKASHQGAMK